MVTRTLEVRKISFLIHKDKMENVIKELKKINKALEITVKGDELQVTGDLHNTRMRKKILDLLWGVSYG